MTGNIADEWRQSIVGTITLAALAGILAMSYSGVRLAIGASASYPVHATFNRVDGLEIGNPVQISGVPVGKVDAMVLQPDNRVRVTLSVDRRYPLPADTSAAIHTDGLFGGKFMVLEPGGDEQMLGDGGTLLYTQDALVVSELLDLIIAEGQARASAGVGAPAAAQPRPAEDRGRGGSGAAP